MVMYFPSVSVVCFTIVFPDLQMLWFHFSTSLNYGCTVHYGIFANATALSLYILYARASALEKWHVALPTLEFHSFNIQTLVNFDLGHKSQMELGFEASSLQQMEALPSRLPFLPGPGRLLSQLHPKLCLLSD